jgi:hypothetical protein
MALQVAMVNTLALAPLVKKAIMAKANMAAKTRRVDRFIDMHTILSQQP